MKKKVITFVACLMMILSFIPSTNVFAGETDDTDIAEQVSRSKTATELDSNNESTVTLSLPSAEEQLTSDIVFVLDKSSCKKETAENAAVLLKDLYDQVANHGAKINVGVIVFGGDARVSYEMQEFPTTEEGLQALTTALTTKPSGIMSGTNMHGGLLAAKAMLEESTTAANRKHVILVSDGLTRLFTGSDGKTKDIYYQYSYSDKLGQKEVGTGEGQLHPKNCVYFGMIGEWVNVRTQSTNDANFVVPYGDWNTYFSKVEDWVAADGDTYAFNFEEYGNDPTALTTKPSGIMSGTNMHGGLLAAKAMLEESTTAANRKHVILVSDGLTRLFTGSDGKTKDIYYQYSYSDKLGQKEVGTGEGQLHPKNCVYFGMIGEWVNVRTQSTNDANFVVPYGDWNTYFSKVEDWVAADGDTYAFNFEEYGNDPTEKVKDSATGDIIDDNFKYIGHTDYENHAMSVDRAVYEGYYAFTDLVDAGYKCYTVLNGSTEFGKAFMGAMNEYAGNGEVDFATIGQDILYAVGAGSVVEDKMGADFDFVEGSFELTVGGVKLDSNTVGNVTYFGENASEENFRFKVEYDKDEDKFTWYINENVSNFAPVQLSYKVKLVNVKKEAGTYEVPTNEYAVLRVVDSEGQEREGLLEFPVPTVSYTVKAQPSTGDHVSLKLLVGVMAVSAVAAIIIVSKKKKLFN